MGGNQLRYPECSSSALTSRETTPDSADEEEDEDDEDDEDEEEEEENFAEEESPEEQIVLQGKRSDPATPISSNEGAARFLPSSRTAQELQEAYGHLFREGQEVRRRVDSLTC